MSGLIALFDDVAAIAKVAATSLDDVATAAAKAGSKAAGVVIDDAAVTPTYVQGFSAERELPMIWRITKGSLRNKLLFLLPVAMALAAFLPQAITPILMLGGAYLCFEGAEKVFHLFWPHASHAIEEDLDVRDPAHLEEAKVAGAIKTDFILSAEIMTITLAAIPPGAVWQQALVLAVVGTGITALVYGSVALIVRADDLGLMMVRQGRLRFTRRLGRTIVAAMPNVLVTLSIVGTVAMLWVGGSIVLHGLETTHLWPWPYEKIHHLSEAAAHAVPAAAGFVGWAVTAVIDGIVGLALGLALLPLATRVIMPLWARISGQKEKAAH